MAPFHRHFELASWAEATVIIRLRLLAAICRALGLDIFYSERLATTYSENVNILAFSDIRTTLSTHILSDL